MLDIMISMGIFKTNKRADVIPLHGSVTAESGDQTNQPDKLSRRDVLIGVGALATAAGAVGVLARWANQEQASNKQAAEQSAARSEMLDAAADQRGAEMQAEQDARVAEYLSSVQEALESGEIAPTNGTIIIDRGVRKWKTPFENGYSSTSRGASPTKEVLAISNPVVYEGNILVPNDNPEVPFTLDDGRLNPDKFSYIKTGIIGQTDDATGNLYYQELPGVVSDTDAQAAERLIVNGQALMVAKTYESVAAAEEAVGKAA